MPKKSPTSAENLRPILEKLPTIRVIIDNGIHFGNQAANIELMKHLRKNLGFKGNFEVVYEEQAKPKILRLTNLPWTDQNEFYSVELNATF